MRRRDLVFVPAGIIVMLGLAYVCAHRYATHRMLQAARETIAGQARLAEVQLRTAMDAVITKAQEDFARVRNGGSVALREMRALVEPGGGFAALTLYDTGGSVVASTSDAPDAASPSLFPLALNGRTTISAPYRDAGEAGGPLLQILEAVVDEHGQPVGVLAGTLPLDRVWTEAAAHLEPEGVRLGLLDAHGLLLQAPRTDPDAAPGTAEPSAGPEFLYLARELDVAGDAAGPAWTLVVTSDREPVLRLVQRTAAVHTGAAMLMIGLFGWVGLRMTRDLVSPLRQASKAATRLMRGELDMHLPEEGPRELQSIGAALNHMISEVKYHRHTLSGMVAARTQNLEAARNALAKNASQLRASYDSAKEAILVVDTESGHVLQANRQLHDIFGFKDVQVEDVTAEDLAGALRDLFASPTEFAERWAHYMAHPSEAGSAEWELARPQRRILSVYTSPVRGEDQRTITGRLWTFQDITQQRDLELKLRQSQKLEAMGHLAGSIAHDFNNLLTVILGNLSIARLESDGSPDMAANLAAAEDATHEATQLARQLMGLSNRGGRLQLRPLQINEVVRDVTRQLAQSAGPLIRTHLALAEDLWHVPADAAQLRQVVLNLCMNAVDAMPAGGTLTLHTENLQVARGEHQMPPHAEPGDFVRLTVQDDGVGMDPATRDRAFEPFFTTKAHHGNQGLGLAMAYGAIQKHGGWMTCESEPGKGSQFHMYLVRTEQRSEPMTVKPASRIEDAGAPCILVVDDEAGVRRIAVSVLNRCGYATIQAGDGEEALRMFGGNGNNVDLVLLDLSMPKLSGRETFLELKRMRADVPVLLCSGYPVSLDEFEQETGFRPEGVIQKPFNVMGLGSRVGELLGKEVLKLAT